MWTLQISADEDGLIGLKRVGGTDGNTLVPDLAESLPQPTDNGRTYTFQLHDGIRFSNGKTLRPSDVRATFERMFRAYGFDDAGRTTEALSRRRAPTTTSRSSAHPPARRIRKPATCRAGSSPTTPPHRHVPPLRAGSGLPLQARVAVRVHPAARDAGRPGLKLPSTGPYMVAAYHPKAFLPHLRAALKRNPYFHVWSPTAQPDGFPRSDRLSTVGRPTTKNATFYARSFRRRPGRLRLPQVASRRCSRRRGRCTRRSSTPSPARTRCTGWLNAHAAALQQRARARARARLRARPAAAGRRPGRVPRAARRRASSSRRASPATCPTARSPPAAVCAPGAGRTSRAHVPTSPVRGRAEHASI